METFEIPPEKIFKLNKRYQAAFLFMIILCTVLFFLIPLALGVLWVRMKAQIAIYSDRMEYTWFKKTIYMWRDIESVESTDRIQAGGLLGMLIHNYLGYGLPMLTIKTKNRKHPLFFAARAFDGYHDIVALVEKKSGKSP